MYTDHCWTWSLGKPSGGNERLLLAGRKAVENCIPLCISGNHTGILVMRWRVLLKRMVLMF